MSKLDYDEFMDTVSEKVKEGDLIYRALALFIAKRFEVKIPTYFDLPDCVYSILNHYIEEVENIPFEEWLNRNDGPFIRNRNELRDIFPEFKFIKDDKKLLDVVNKFYNLDLKISEDYFYSLSMDFESFTPINCEELPTIKNEITVLKKYGYDTSDLEDKLNSFGLSDEELELI